MSKKYIYRPNLSEETFDLIRELRIDLASLGLKPEGRSKNITEAQAINYCVEWFSYLFEHIKGSNEEGLEFTNIDDVESRILNMAKEQESIDEEVESHHDSYPAVTFRQEEKPLPTVQEMIESGAIPSMGKYFVECVSCADRAVEYLSFNGDFKTQEDGTVYGGVLPVCDYHFETASDLNQELAEWWMENYYNNWVEPDEE